MRWGRLGPTLWPRPVRRVGVLLVALMLVSSVAAGLVLTAQGPGDPSEPPPASVGAPSAVARPSAPFTGPEAVRFGPAGSPSPVTHANQSRLWYADGGWWAVLLDGETLTHRIFSLDAETASWTDTGVVVDERRGARQDVLWDGETLVVASAGADPEPDDALTITRFSYDPAARRYARDANFPVPITAVGVEGQTITRDATGRLWVAYRSAGALALDHSLEGDLSWRGPFVPTAAQGDVEQAAITTVGTRVALAWTRPDEDAVRMATHRTDGPADVWEELPAAPVASLGATEDEISIAVDNAPGAERVYVAVATGATETETRSRLDPQVVLVQFPLDGTPTVYLVGRLVEQHVDPIVLVNAAARELYVVAAAPRGGGEVYFKQSSLDDIAFPPGLGTLLVPAGAAYPELGHPTSTKQALDATSGIVVAATDAAAGVYAFGSVGLRPAPGTGPTPAPSAPSVVTALDQTFDGLTVGGPVPGWELEGDPPPAMVVTVLQGVDSAARLSSTSTTDARACATYTIPAGSTIRLQAELLYNLATGDDLRLLQARGSGGEFASVRLRDDELVYFDGATRVRSGVTVAPGRWYRAVLTFDLAAATYGIEVVAVATNETILATSDLAIRSAEGGAPNRVCAELPPQPGLDLYLDDVRVDGLP